MATLRNALGCAFLVVSFAVLSECQESGLYVLQHQLEPDKDFVARGHLRIRGSGPAVLEQHTLTKKDRASLQRLAASGDLYRLRLCPAGVTGDVSSDSRCVATFIPACALCEARFSDFITLTLDGADGIVAITLSVKPDVNSASCTSSSPSLTVDHFNTKVDVVTASAAPVPDTQTYIEKLEQEKKRKEKGEDQDNRSFLAKYWMYIIPAVVILLMMSSQDQGGGGGN